MSTTETQTLPVQQPPAWMPPPPPTYVPPPRPRRTGLVLFWPTLALIAIAEGTLAIIDTNTSVQPSAYVALAVAVTAVMLLIGAFVGRPGGLIALGLVTSLGLGITTAVEATTDWNTGGETLTVAPTFAASLQDSYAVPNGHLTLDLGGVRDVAAWTGGTSRCSSTPARSTYTCHEASTPSCMPRCTSRGASTSTAARAAASTRTSLARSLPRPRATPPRSPSTWTPASARSPSTQRAGENHVRPLHRPGSPTPPTAPSRFRTSSSGCCSSASPASGPSARAAPSAASC